MGFLRNLQEGKPRLGDVEWEMQRQPRPCSPRQTGRSEPRCLENEAIWVFGGHRGQVRGERQGHGGDSEVPITVRVQGSFRTEPNFAAHGVSISLPLLPQCKTATDQEIASADLRANELMVTASHPPQSPLPPTTSPASEVEMKEPLPPRSTDDTRRSILKCDS